MTTTRRSAPPAAPEDRPADAAALRTVPLRFRFGEVTLFAVGLRLRVVDTHFTRLGDDPEATFRALPPVEGADGTLLRSHPVREDPPRVTLLRDALRYVPQIYDRCFTSLEGTFEAYLDKTFSSKSRSTLRRKVRKWEKHCGGTIDCREYRTPEEFDAFHALARGLSRRTYQERLLDAGLPEDEAFVRDARAAAARGAVRAWLLFHDDRPVAYLYCPIDDGIALYEYVGHDPEYNRWSPGTVLQYVAFERLFAQGDVELFDFTEGEGQHKQLFATGRTRCADVYFLRRTLRHRLLLGLHRALDGLSDGVVRLLDRIGLKQRIKKWIRRKSVASTPS